MQRYKNLFERQKLGLFVNFGQFPCSGFRIRIIQINSSIRIHADPDIGHIFYKCFISLLQADSHSLIILGHTDAVWDLSYNPGKQQLLSSSADGSVRQSHHPEFTPFAFVTVALILA
jgi:hypothetical protein